MKIIDLHGIRHEDVQDFFWQNCKDFKAPFIVITGNSDRMKKIVFLVADNLGLSVRNHIDNPGRLIIYESN